MSFSFLGDFLKDAFTLRLLHSHPALQLCDLDIIPFGLWKRREKKNLFAIYFLYLSRESYIIDTVFFIKKLIFALHFFFTALQF